MRPGGRTFAAVAFTWDAAAPHHQRLLAALSRRATALQAYGVDVIVVGRGGAVPAGMLPGCRLAAGDDRAEVMRGILTGLARRGVGPGLLLVVGSEFGAPDGPPGPDSLLLVPEAARAVTVSVGREAAGAPAGAVVLGGGGRTLLGLLDEQIRRYARQRVPAVDEDPEWILPEPRAGRLHRRVTEALFTLGAGGVATRGSVEESGSRRAADGPGRRGIRRDRLRPASAAGPAVDRPGHRAAAGVRSPGAGPADRGAGAHRTERSASARCGPCGWPASPFPGWSPCGRRRRRPACLGRAIRCGGRRRPR